MRRNRYGFLSILLAFVMAFTTILPSGVGQMVAKAEETPDIVVELKDSEFTGDLWNDSIWNVTPSTWENATFEKFSYASDEWLQTSEEQGETGFKFWMKDPGTFTLTQQIDLLPAGNYTLTSYVMGEKAEIQITLHNTSGNKTALEGYNT